MSKTKQDQALSGELLDAEGGVLEGLRQGSAQLAGEAIARDLLANGAADALMAAGNIQALQMVATVADFSLAKIFRKVKETKVYRGLPYYDKDGKPATVATLEEFCEAFLGRSARRCRELSGNLEALGEQLYQETESIGLNARQYAALRNLPVADEAKLEKAKALIAEDREQALDMLMEILGRQEERRQLDREAREKAEAQAAEAKADLEAAHERLAEARREKDDLKASMRRTPVTIDLQMAQWPEMAAMHTHQIRQHLMHLDQLISEAERVDIPPDDSPEVAAHQRAMRAFYDVVGQELYLLLNRDVSGVLAHANQLLVTLAYPGEQPPWELPFEPQG